MAIRNMKKLLAGIVIASMCSTILVSAEEGEHGETQDIANLDLSIILDSGTDYNQLSVDINAGTMSIPYTALSGDAQSNLSDYVSSEMQIFPSFSEMIEQMSSGMSMSEAMEGNGISIDSSKLFESGSLDADYGIVNMLYNSASSNLSEQMAANQGKYERSSAAELFSQEYGDVIGSIDMSAYTIPDSFNTSEMLSSMASAYEEAYSGNSLINSAASSVSIGSIFEAASQTLTMPSLASYESLSALTSSANASLQANSAAKYSQNMGNAASLGNSAYNQIKSTIGANSVSDFEGEFERLKSTYYEKWNDRNNTQNSVTPTQIAGDSSSIDSPYYNTYLTDGYGSTVIYNEKEDVYMRTSDGWIIEDPSELTVNISLQGIDSLSELSDEQWNDLEERNGETVTDILKKNYGSGSITVTDITKDTVADESGAMSMDDAFGSGN